MQQESTESMLNSHKSSGVSLQTEKIPRKKNMFGLDFEIPDELS
jgi:hypothetical protein